MTGGDVELDTLSTDTVLWNPWIAKAQAMGDFTDAEYVDMVRKAKDEQVVWCEHCGLRACNVNSAREEMWQCDACHCWHSKCRRR